jgi:hypothetical protein
VIGTPAGTAPTGALVIFFAADRMVVTFLWSEYTPLPEEWVAARKQVRPREGGRGLAVTHEGWFPAPGEIVLEVSMRKVYVPAVVIALFVVIALAQSDSDYQSWTKTTGATTQT